MDKFRRGSQTVWYWFHDRRRDLTHNYSDWTRLASGRGGLSWRIGDIKGQTGTRRLVKGVERRANKGWTRPRKGYTVPYACPTAASLCYLLPVFLADSSVSDSVVSLSVNYVPPWRKWANSYSFVVHSSFNQSRRFLHFRTDNSLRKLQSIIFLITRYILAGNS